MVFSIPPESQTPTIHDTTPGAVCDCGHPNGGLDVERLARLAEAERLLELMGAAWHIDWDYEVSQGYRKELKQQYDDWYAGLAPASGASQQITINKESNE